MLFVTYAQYTYASGRASIHHMANIKFITANDLAARVDEEGLQIVDIRDSASYEAGHIKGSRPLSNSSVKSFIERTDQSAPLVVCCYHGNSSQGAASFLVSEGFSDVYSLDGGFEMWRALYPELVER